MKKLHFSALTCVILSITFVSSALANHRTGELALPELIVAGDFNEDGNRDLAVNVTGFDNIAILTGDGLGGFTLNGHIATDTLPKGLTAGDINRDRHIDLVGCSNWGYNAEVHLGDGLGGFGRRDNLVREEGGPNRALLADFNKDGNLDLAVNGPDEGVLLIYLGNGKGKFLPPPFELEDLQHCLGFSAADLNGDRNLDLAVVTSGQDHSVHIFLGDGTGNFTAGDTFAIDPDGSNAAPGDLNNDGNLDLVVSGAGPENTTGNFITTYLGNGSGSFTEAQDIQLGGGNTKGPSALGDFNEDGNLDVAFPQTGLRPGVGTKVLLFFGDGHGQLVTQPPVTVGQEPHTVIAVDINRDHHLDLVVSNRTDGTVMTLLGSGNGGFTVSSNVSVVCLGGVCD